MAGYYYQMYGPDTYELIDRIAKITDDTLDISGLRVTGLPPLPHTLKNLWCSFTLITRFRSLPAGLEDITCENCPLVELPVLPKGLRKLICNFTPLTSLPELPPNLKLLSCNNTKIKEFPTLPKGLTSLFCQSSLVTTLPPIPSSLRILYCNNTGITVFPPLPSLFLLKYEGCPNLLIKVEPGETREHYIGRWNQWWDEQASKKRCQDRNRAIKEDLMAEIWHPLRVEKLLQEGGWHLVDSY
jgi:hypothetical protein